MKNEIKDLVIAHGWTKNQAQRYFKRLKQLDREFDSLIKDIQNSQIIKKENLEIVINIR